MDVMAPNDVVSVVTTVGNAQDAQTLAQALVERRLAACVQVEAGLVSHYRWNGQLQAEPELRLTAKTLASRLPALEAFMAQAHPYDTPQLTWQYVWASAAYAAWVAQELAPAGSGDPPIV
ncbi:MAG TPA: divalent-cation tolerance protein CutA [Ramlibacter sp.]|nr:divalent-cation tolerance protein CutA [Ramlibacter sp.]